MPTELVLSLLDKMGVLAVGVALAAMAVRLLHAGLYEHAKSVQAASEPADVLWKQVLPGTMFALFAGVVVVVGLRQPLLARAVPVGEQSQFSRADDPATKPEAGSGLIGHPLDWRALESANGVEAGSALSLPEW